MGLIISILHTIFLFMLGSSIIFGPYLGYPSDKLQTFNIIYLVGLYISWVGMCIHTCYQGETTPIEIHEETTPIEIHVETTPIEIQLPTLIPSPEPPIICNGGLVCCPICRQDNYVLENQSKLFGVENKCVVCLEHVCEVYLPTCGHVCLCNTCAFHMSEDYVILISDGRL